MGAIADAIVGAVQGGLNIAQFGYDVYNNNRNYDLAVKNYEYQKEMQQKAWEREDNAIQRRVADLKAAGLSPVLAAGSGAQASSPISTTAPQYGSLNVPSLDSVLDSIQKSKTISQMNANLAYTNEQKKLIAAQIKGQNIQNEIDNYDYNIAKKAGISVKYSTPLARGYKEVSNIINEKGDSVKNGVNKVFHDIKESGDEFAAAKAEKQQIKQYNKKKAAAVKEGHKREYYNQFFDGSKRDYPFNSNGSFKN